MKEFTQVHGLGRQKATQLIRQGINTLEQLIQEAQRNPKLLARDARIGESVLHLSLIVNAAVVCLNTTICTPSPVSQVELDLTCI